MNAQSYPKYIDSNIPCFGLVPNHWPKKKLKHVLRISSGQSPPDDKHPTDSLYPIYGANGIIGYCSKYNSDRTRVLLGRVGSVGAVNLAPKKVWISDNTLILLPDLEKLDLQFSFYLMQCLDLIADAVQSAQPLITATKVLNREVYIPPLIEQNSIAQYLIQKTTIFDHAILRKKKQIQLLQEKKQSSISRITTGGIDLAKKTKYTGFEWLQSIPQHWLMERSKLVFEEINERSESGGEELLTVSHITGVTPRSEKQVYMFMAETLEGYKRCNIGDLVINTMWAWMGALGFSKQDGIVSPAYHVYRFRNNCYEPRYYEYLFRSARFIAEILRFSKGVWISRLRLYPEGFFKIRIPIPPHLEQIEIANQLDQETRRIDTLINKIQESIDLLSEYRNALISAAVTGKINVHDVVS